VICSLYRKYTSFRSVGRVRITLLALVLVNRIDQPAKDKNCDYDGPVEYLLAQAERAVTERLPASGSGQAEQVSD
jgi:hypothetical protein